MPLGFLLLAPLWPLTFFSGEQPRALWALLFVFVFLSESVSVLSPGHTSRSKPLYMLTIVEHSSLYWNVSIIVDRSKPQLNVIINVAQTNHLTVEALTFLDLFKNALRITMSKKTYYYRRLHVVCCRWPTLPYIVLTHTISIVSRGLYTCKL